MNRRERRYGRMYLLPLLLALTGLSLLPLEWVLRLSSFDAFGDLAQTMLHSCISLFYPLVLMVLFACRISPKSARIVSIVSLALTLVHLILILVCNSKTPQGLLLWVPGRMLVADFHNLQAVKNAQNRLLAYSDLCFLLCNLSSVFTCLIYAAIKTKSDKRNAEFDRRNAYFTGKTAAPAAKAPDEEPTRIVSLHDNED